MYMATSSYALSTSIAHLVHCWCTDEQFCPSVPPPAQKWPGDLPRCLPHTLSTPALSRGYGVDAHNIHSDKLTHFQHMYCAHIAMSGVAFCHNSAEATSVIPFYRYHFSTKMHIHISEPHNAPSHPSWFAQFNLSSTVPLEQHKQNKYVWFTMMRGNNAEEC